MLASDIQELLTKAAEAVSIELDINTPCEGGFRAKQNARWTSRWAPHLDDGDSARLEAALGLDVLWLSGCVEVRNYDLKASAIEFYRNHNNDKQAARRMAGVKAAAQHEIR